MNTYENIMTTFRFNHLDRETITELNNLFKLHGIDTVLEVADNVGIIDESNFYLLKSDLRKKKEVYIMKTFTYNNLTVTAERKGHDTNGNPLYVLWPVNFKFVHCDKAYRNYTARGYYLIDSYEINEDAPWFLKELYNQTRDGWKVDLPTNDWDKHYNLVNEMTGQHFLIDIDDIDRMEELTNIELLLQLAWKEV